MNRGSRRGVAARLGPLAAAVVAVLGLTTSPVLAQDPGSEDPTTTAVEGADEGVEPYAGPLTPPGPPGLDLVGQTPFVAPTDRLDVDLDVTGAPEGAELSFTLFSRIAPGDSRTAQARFDEWVDGTGTGSLFNSPKTFPLANLPPADGSGRVNAEFEIAPDGAPEPLVGFRIADPGVYPFRIDLTEAEGGAVLDSITTFLVRLPASSERAPAMSVAPIAELRAPVALAPDSQRSIEPTSLNHINDLVDTLADHPGVPVSIGATPETLEALLGIATVPATLTAPATTGPDLVARLQRSLAGRALTGSPYVVLDVSAWTASGMDAALAYQLSHGVNVTEAVLGGTAPIDQRTWVAEPTLTLDGLDQLHDLGVDQLVLDGSVVGPLDPKAFPEGSTNQVARTQPFDVEDASGDRVRAVTADATFGQRLVETDDEALNAQILVADLAVSYFAATGTQVNDILDIPRGIAFEVPDDDLALRSLGPFLTALTTTPPAAGGGVAILSPSTIPNLFTLPPATAPGATAPVVRTVNPVATAGPTDMGDYPAHLDDAEYAVSAYESMVVDTSPTLVFPLRQLLDVSGAAELDPGERQAYLDAATGSVDAALAGVRIPEQDSITLTASEYIIPIFLENDLPYPVTVHVALESTKLTFPDGADLEVLLQPGSNRVPVQVKTVSGGTFPLDIAVSTPDRRVELGGAVIEMRSTAVSGLGLALTIGAGLFLAVWWARNWRKTRRTTQAAAADAEVGDPPDEPAGSTRFTVGPLADLDEETAAAGSAGGETAVGAGPGGVAPDPPK